MEEICRACLDKNKNMLPIFKSKTKPLQISEMISSICSINLSPNDCLPKQICVSCFDIVKECYNFKLKCEMVDRSLYTYLYENKSILDVYTTLKNEIDQFEKNAQMQIKHELADVNNSIVENENEFDCVSTWPVQVLDVQLKNEDLCNIQDKCSNSDYDSDDSKTLAALKIKKKIPKGRSSKLTLKKYQKLKYSKNELKKCEWCNFTTTLSQRFKFHMYQHTGEKPLACSMCNYRCIRQNSLRTHILTHATEKPYKCSYCDYKCSSSSNMKRHIRRHTNDRPYSCNICEYKSSHPSDFKDHLRIHSGEKPYLCDQCHYRSTTMSALRKHKGNKHSTERNYICDQCDRRFKTKGTLVVHQKTHSDDRKFSCNFCDYKSIQLVTLQNHLRMVHTGERPFACDQCSYRCVSLTYLKTHQKTHSTVKLFSCDKCAHSCRTQFKLKSHMRTHTGEKPYQCDECEFKSSSSSSLHRHKKRNHTTVKVIHENEIIV